MSYDPRIEARVLLEKEARECLTASMDELLLPSPSKLVFAIAALVERKVANARAEERASAARSAEEIAALVECERQLRAIKWDDACEYAGRIDASVYLSVDQLHAVLAALARLDAVRKERGA